MMRRGEALSAFVRFLPRPPPPSISQSFIVSALQWGGAFPFHRSQFSSWNLSSSSLPSLSRALFRREPCSERVRICPRAVRGVSATIIRWLPHNVRMRERTHFARPSLPSSLLLSCLANVSGEFPRTFLTPSRARLVEEDERFGG